MLKKLLLVAVVVMAATSLCFAEQAEKSTKSVPVPLQTTVTQIGTVIGKITQVADGRLKINDPKGNPVLFTIDGTANIVDTNLKAATLQELKEGDEVEVKYSSGVKGESKATEIKLKK